jgi:hypothetical protein
MIIVILVIIIIVLLLINPNSWEYTDIIYNRITRRNNRELRKAEKEHQARLSTIGSRKKTTARSTILGGRKSISRRKSLKRNNR